MPKVSICIPTYNSARFLGETIESVLAQQFADFELVVCDNASTDETPELCGRYPDPRLRHVRFEQLVGQAANWNRCLELATGELVILLHADDLLVPEYLERAVAALEQHPEAGMLFCCAEHIDAAGGHLSYQRAYTADHAGPGDELARRLLLHGCLLNPAGVLVRRTAYEAVGRFTEEVVWGVDWHMWTRLALHSGFVYLADPLSRYREHGQSGTSGVMRTARNAQDERWMFDDLFAHCLPADSPLRALRAEANRGIAHRTWCFAEEMCQTGFPAAARAQLRAAFRTRPAIALEGRFWLLWASTYCGYAWFRRALTLRRKLAHS
jgi:glycosyltransferase involved in cell wall biosynthesis